MATVTPKTQSQKVITGLSLDLSALEARTLLVHIAEATDPYVVAVRDQITKALNDEVETRGGSTMAINGRRLVHVKELRVGDKIETTHTTGFPFCHPVVGFKGRVTEVENAETHGIAIVHLIDEDSAFNEHVTISNWVYLEQ